MNASGPQPPKPGREIHDFTVDAVVDHTASVRELKLSTAKDFNFQAGQFITLQVPQADKPALRAYSIASGDRNKRKLNLIFKFIPNGVASTFVWKVKAGEVLKFTGPFGRVLFLEPPTQQIIFLNTGTGLTQHLSYLLSKADLYPETRFRLLFGLSSETDIYHQELLQGLEKSLTDFKFEYVLSNASPSWQGKRGYVQHFISQFDYRKIPSTFYLCGNRAMIKEVKQLLTEGDGFDSGKILTEAFD